MAYTVKSLHPLFAAEIRGHDFSRPLTPADAAEIRGIMDRYSVGVVRTGKPPTDAQHAAFGRNFGPLMDVHRKPVFRVNDGQAKELPRLTEPGVLDVSNLDKDGNIYPPNHRRALFKKGDLLWHADVSFNRNRATYSMLAGHVLPPSGGDTEFCDLRAAYDDLPAAMKQKIESLTAVHSIWTSRAKAGFPEPAPNEVASAPPVEHRLVQVHPGSKRRTLYLGAHASHIKGWPEEEGRALLRELTEHAGQRKYVYRHRWELGDLVIWDNYCTMHRATEFDDQKYVRDMRRITVREWDEMTPDDELDRLVARRNAALAEAMA